jgi:outer membrane protein assembly factor BamB
LWAPLSYHDGSLYFGSDDSTFYALDIEKQEVRWQVKTGGIIRSAADIAGGTVLFGSDDGFLYALAAETGAESWRFDLGGSGVERVLPAAGPPYEYDYLQSSPIHHGGTVYVGSANGVLYAVDRETGQERWRYQADGKIRSTPVVDGRNVYFGSWDGHLYAVGALEGNLVWRFDTGGIVQGSPALGAGRVIVGSRSATVFAVDARTGTEAWRYVHEDGSWVESSPVFADGVIYIGSSDALSLLALDVETGQPIWDFETGGWSWSTPYLAGGVVYIGGLSAFPYYFDGIDLRGGFHAVDQESGASLWEFSPGRVEGYITGGVFSTPVLVDGVVYVAGLDGRLYALKE